MVKWMDSDTEPLSSSKPPPPCHSQTSTAAPHNTTEHAPHSHSFLCSFCFHLKQKNSCKLCNTLHRQHHLPCECLFAQDLPTFMAEFCEKWRWKSNPGIQLCSCQLGAAGGVWLFGGQLAGWTLTSPRGPGSLTCPGLRWCRVCRRTPGCCVCSGPLSSGTPDSSCPAGTCSTTRQPPSHRTLCHLKYRRIRVNKEGYTV